MTLLAGSALEPKKFFQSGEPKIHGSNFDLSIGSIFDHEGKKVSGPFTIKPGHMVQVVSSEVFCLSDRVTGHVTYKTTLTKKGIWALTVGVVDPGWDGPVATTLLNFSRVDHAIAEGDAFLRVIFFEHEPVPEDKIRKAPPLDVYLKEIQKTAASSFPMTFLNTEKIAEAAGRSVLERVRTEALVWVAGIALMFTLLQLVVNVASYRPHWQNTEVTNRDLSVLLSKIDSMQAKIIKLEQAIPATPILPSPPTTPLETPTTPQR